MKTNNEYDCIVIGGGPAGSTVAAMVAGYGHRTLVIERARFPRFHIGESLMPETYWTFKRIGMLEKMQRSDFVKKYSVQFANAMGKESAPFYFDEMNPHECSQTWQVLRSKFDQMMLDNAAERGAEVWMETNVAEVLFEGGTQGPRDRGTEGEVRSAAGHGTSRTRARECGVRNTEEGAPRAAGVIAQKPDGSRVELRCNVVVDATGINALISKKLGLRHHDPQLRKAAVFGHYQGARRDPGKDEGATLVLSVQEQNGWFWYIPLENDIVSVGVVGDLDYLITGRGAPEQTLEEEIERCPCLVPRLEKATRVSPVHVLSDFSYNSSRCAGDGWVLVGDAFAFLDPIYSSGVFLALKSGELAGEAIHEALVGGDFSAGRLGGWGEKFYAGMQCIRKLVYAYYAKGFSFGQFVRAHPEFKKNLVDLLIGDVFRPEVNAIFDPMGRMCALPEPLRIEPASGKRSAVPA